jgi:MarR family transcriptional regulator, temperature-dependent positive regulator of motility
MGGSSRVVDGGPVPPTTPSSRFLSVDGTRASALAERSGLTRQALTQIVDDLEALGYVTRRADPADRRAKLVAYTERGREVYETGRRVIAAIEREMAAQLGDEDYEALRRGLATIRRPAGGPGA